MPTIISTSDRSGERIGGASSSYAGNPAATVARSASVSFGSRSASLSASWFSTRSVISVEDVAGGHDVAPVSWAWRRVHSCTKRIVRRFSANSATTGISSARPGPAGPRRRRRRRGFMGGGDAPLLARQHPGQQAAQDAPHLVVAAGLGQFGQGREGGRVFRQVRRHQRELAADRLGGQLASRVKAFRISGMVPRTPPDSR